MTDGSAGRPVVHAVVINGRDTERLVEFWTAMLGVEVARAVGPHFTWLQPQHEGGISLAVQKVDSPTDGRNRLHLDLKVDDLETATARVHALGGRVVEEHSVGDFTWRVMADPEDNEFCIAPG